MSEIIPVLELGKARAKEAFLAGSGRVINPSRNPDTRQVRYRMGRHRGKTPDQVDEEFQRKWDAASPAIRAKYERMAEPKTPSGYGAKVEKPAARPAAAKVSTFEELTTPPDTSTDGMRHSIGDGAPSAPVAGGSTSAKKPGSFGPGSFGYSFRDDMESITNSLHGRGFKPNAKPNDAPAATPAAAAAAAPAIEKPGAFAGAQRRGGTSPSGQQGRISSGASPSAPPAVRDEAADVADKPWRNVAGQPPQTPVPRPMPDQKQPGTMPAVSKAPYGQRINQLTGLPFGYRPGDKVAPAQQAAADESVNNQRIATAFADAPKVPVARPIQTPAPKRYDPTEAGGAFSREAYARTAAAQQTGYEQKAIREGKASEATRAKHADYVAKMEADRKMFPAAKPVSTFPASKPRFAMVR